MSDVEAMESMSYFDDAEEPSKRQVQLWFVNRIREYMRKRLDDMGRDPHVDEWDAMDFVFTELDAASRGPYVPGWRDKAWKECGDFINIAQDVRMQLEHDGLMLGLGGVMGFLDIRYNNKERQELFE